MVTPRDWLPRYPAGDVRNVQHQKEYDFYRRAFPDSPPWEAQVYADTKAEARETLTVGGCRPLEKGT